MAKYRQLYTEFWSDGFVLELTPEEKYFYLYLMTNQKTSQCGIYELPKRLIEMETGYNRDTIEKLLKRFIDYEKIAYCNETREIMILNWIKYNEPNNINAVKCVNKELRNIKSDEFKCRFFKICADQELDIEKIFYGVTIKKIDNKNAKQRENIVNRIDNENINPDVNSNDNKNNCNNEIYDCNPDSTYEKVSVIESEETSYKDNATVVKGDLNADSDLNMNECENESTECEDKKRILQKSKAESEKGNSAYFFKPLTREYEGAYKGLPSNRIRSNKEEVINNKQKVRSNKEEAVSNKQKEVTNSKSYPQTVNNCNYNFENDSNNVDNIDTAVGEVCPTAAENKLQHYDETAPVDNNLSPSSNKKNTKAAMKNDSSCSNNHCDFKSLVNVFQNNIHPLTPIELQKLQDWSNDMSCSVIVMAIEEAVNYDARNMRYIDRILNNWLEKGITTPQGVRAYRRKWEEKKKNSSGKSNGHSDFCDGEMRRNYDFKELERKLLGLGE